MPQAPAAPSISKQRRTIVLPGSSNVSLASIVSNAVPHNGPIAYSTFPSNARRPLKLVQGWNPCLEMRLLEYLRTSLVHNTALSEVAIQAFVSAAGNRPLSLNLRANGSVPMPLLHLVVLNEATRAPVLERILSKLLHLGAAPEAEDDDGDNALVTLLSIASESEEDGETLSEAALVAQLGALSALLQSKRLPINQKDINEVCAWLRRFAAEQLDAKQRVLDILATRCGDENLAVVWCSEQLLEYLADQAYHRKRSVEAQRVLDFLAEGASPRHSTNGATALLMIVLNPYNNYEELLPIFRCMLSTDPMCATIRDGFKMMPMQWAAEYRNVSSQHKLPRPNPANLLAILPSIVEMLPDDVDAGEVCLQTGAEALRRGTTTQKLRFEEGDQVVCRVQELSGSYVWEQGVVVGLWYREVCWPGEHPGAPYEVLLDVGLRVFALVDHDRIIRKRGEPRGVSNSHCSSSHFGLARFRKQADDGGGHSHAGHSHCGHGCCDSGQIHGGQDLKQPLLNDNACFSGHGHDAEYGHGHGHGHVQGDGHCCRSSHGHGQGHSHAHAHSHGLASSL